MAARLWSPANGGLLELGVVIDTFRSRWSYAVAQAAHRPQHVLGDGRHESPAVHLSHLSDRWTIYCPPDEWEDMGGPAQHAVALMYAGVDSPCGRRKLGKAAWPLARDSLEWTQERRSAGFSPVKVKQ